MLCFAATTPLPGWAWLIFFGFVAAMLALDLGVFQRKPHAVTIREAIAWCIVWSVIGLGFGAVVWWWRGSEAGAQYVAAYLVEVCLSVDNVFVFIVIFTYFQVARQFQHRVLFWGIIGAVLMRSAFILAGVGIIARAHWILYLFGVFLVYSGIKLARPGAHEKIDPAKNHLVAFFRRHFPVVDRFSGPRFFLREGNRRVATLLVIVLLVIETTDLLFALDSLPAVLAITKSGFVALTSNIFAIIGLRSLYFALSGVMQLFRFLKIGLAVILCLIGAKMLAEPWWYVSTRTSLVAIGCVLATAVLMSVLVPAPEQRATAASDSDRSKNEAG